MSPTSKGLDYVTLLEEWETPTVGGAGPCGADGCDRRVRPASRTRLVSVRRIGDRPIQDPLSS